MEDKTNITEKMVSVKRVHKVVKGGRVQNFSVLMVAGDQHGRVGMGKGRAREVPVAAQKGIKLAQRNIAKVNLTNGTIFHSVMADHGAAKVYLQPASKGTGIIAGGPMRAVLEAVGVSDVLAKSIGSTNPYNLVRATIKALLSVSSPADIAAKRGKDIKVIQKCHRLIK